ncbi:ABC transporter permease [Phreatobacter sp. AB_2022a]|uniref:ABC transporter permease n=1 Tax=Phreatobacter sp. AB_2022a TaxID=3003134 RepID=UPI00228739C8|nr:ABC transporter permease [Phreatobacter sp. AB_2022a]MCZ0734356.1 ABC transporter permease [Phreatobacter sp. AB_2022a]
MSSTDLRRWLNSTREFTVPLIALVVLMLIWEAGCRLFDVPEYLLPAPSRIVEDTAAMGWVVGDHTLATLRTILYGFLLSIAVSLPLAVLIASSRLFADAIYPLLVLTQSVPKVAIAPILVVILGPNELPRVIVTFLVAFFPLVISITAGLMAVPSELVELSRSCRATKLQELTRIRLPYSIPFLFSGLKVAIALSVVGAVVGEFVAAERGLGYLITSATAFFKVPVAFGAMLILAILGIVLFQAIVVVERVFFPWAAAEEPRT